MQQLLLTRLGDIGQFQFRFFGCCRSLTPLDNVGNAGSGSLYHLIESPIFFGNVTFAKSYCGIVDQDS